MAISVDPVIRVLVVSGREYPFDFTVYSRAQTYGTGVIGQHYVKVYLYIDENTPLLQREGDTLDYILTETSSGGIVRFNRDITGKYVVIQSDLPYEQKINVHVDSPVKGRDFITGVDAITIMIKQLFELYKTSVHSNAIDPVTGQPLTISINGVQDGRLLQVTKDPTKGWEITSSGMSVADVNKALADIQKALADMHSTQQTIQTIYTSIQGQVSAANLSASSASSAQQATEASKNAVMQLKIEITQLKADALASQVSAQQAKTDALQAKADTQTLKTDTNTIVQQGKTDLARIMAKVPDPSNVAPNLMLYNKAGATNADNKYLPISFSDYLALLNHPLARYLDPATGQKGNVLVVNVPDQQDATKNTVISKSIKDILTDGFNPSDYDFLHFYKGQWRLGTQYRVDGQPSAGDIMHVSSTSAGETVLRPTSVVGGLTVGALNFTGERDGSGVVAKNGLAVHRQVLNIDGSDPDATYIGTISNMGTHSGESFLGVQKTLDVNGKPVITVVEKELSGVLSIAPVSGATNHLQLTPPAGMQTGDSASLAITKTATGYDFVAGGGNGLTVDKTNLPAGTTMNTTLSIPQNLIDGACYDLKLCYDATAKALKANMSLDGGSMGTVIGAPKPTRAGQVPVSQANSVTGTFEYGLKDIPLPDNTDPANNGKMVIQTTQGSWGFTDPATLPESLKQMIYGSWVLNKPTYTYAGGFVSYTELNIAFKKNQDEEEKTIPAGSIAVDHFDHHSIKKRQYGYYDIATSTIQIDFSEPKLINMLGRVYLFEYDPLDDSVTDIGITPEGIPQKLNALLSILGGPEGLKITGVTGKARLQQVADAVMHTDHILPPYSLPGFNIPKGVIDITFLKSDGTIIAHTPPTSQDFLAKMENATSHNVQDLANNKYAWYMLYIRISDGKYFCTIPFHTDFRDTMDLASRDRQILFDKMPPPPVTIGRLSLVCAIMVRGGGTDFSLATDLMIHTNTFKGSVSGASTSGSLSFSTSGFVKANAGNFVTDPNPVDLSHVQNDQLLVYRGGHIEGMAKTDIANNEYVLDDIFPLRMTAFRFDGTIIYPQADVGKISATITSTVTGQIPNDILTVTGVYTLPTPPIGYGYQYFDLITVRLVYNTHIAINSAPIINNDTITIVTKIYGQGSAPTDQISFILQYLLLKI